MSKTSSKAQAKRTPDIVAEGMRVPYQPQYVPGPNGQKLAVARGLHSDEEVCDYCKHEP